MYTPQEVQLDIVCEANHVNHDKKHKIKTTVEEGSSSTRGKKRVQTKDQHTTDTWKDHRRGTEVKTHHGQECGPINHISQDDSGRRA